MRDEIEALLHDWDYHFELHEQDDGSVVVRDAEWDNCTPGSVVEGRVMMRHSQRECHLHDNGLFCFVGNAEDDDWADLVVTHRRPVNDKGHFV